jgi:hypothetical protein
MFQLHFWSQHKTYSFDKSYHIKLSEIFFYLGLKYDNHDNLAHSKDHF